MMTEPCRFFVPGPTWVRPEILAEMTRPMIGHRGAEFRSIFTKVRSDVKELFRTTQDAFVITSSGTGLLEGALLNCTRRRVLVTTCGAFSERWAGIAEQLGVEVDLLQSPWGQPVDPKYPWGATFYGDKGMLKASVYGYDFIPQQGEPVHKDVTYELEQYPEDKTEPRIEKHVAPAIRYHMKDFLAAIDSRGKPVADIEQGYISSSMCILANNAMKLGRTLAWDEARGRVIGDDEANRMLARPYRKPWVHPDPKSV
jgi:hypothetical protein